MRRARVGPAMILLVALAALALAAWLLPASVHIVEWPRRGLHRLAIVGPLYRLRLLAGAAAVAWAALLAAGLRAEGRLARWASVAAPMALLWAWTIPYLPWAAERFPLLLALAGPIRWAFAALAAAGSVWRATRAVRARNLRWPGRRAAFAAALTLYLACGLRSLATIGLGGDEPHYLVITHSLLVDRDLQIENNHERRDYQAFFGGTLRPDFLQRGTSGAIYSIHAPGLSALLLPGYALAGARGAMVTMCVLAALATLAVFDLAALVSTPAIAWLTWVLVTMSVPFVPHAWSLYPEMAGAAIVAWALSWAVRGSPAGAAGWLWRGACLAVLPWLHTKFSVFLAGLALLLAWQTRRSWRHAAALLSPIALSGVAWLAFFYVIYGTIDPQAPYGGYTAQFVRFENVPRSVLGLLFDQKFGVLLYAPVYALAVPGFWALRRDARWRLATLAGVAVAAAYGLSSARLYMWWGGSSAPARFLVPIVPLLVPALARGLHDVRGRVAATFWSLCAAASVTIGVAGAASPADLWLFSLPHGVSRLLEFAQAGAPATAALPTFTQEEWVGPALALVPWIAAVAAAIGLTALVSRVTRSRFWTAAAALVAVTTVPALAQVRYGSDARVEATARGGFALIEGFDPSERRAFDYESMRRLTPAEWLGQLSLTFDREPGSEPDELGRLTGPLSLPPGRYEADVWFDASRPLGGTFQAALGNTFTLARREGPLPNPAVLTFDLPIAVPALWMQLSDLVSARAVRQLRIRPLSVEPRAQRSRVPVLSVEAFERPMNAYVAFTDESSYPEHGVFWTRGQERTRVLLAPAGAGTAVVTVHVGPRPTAVTLLVGEHREQMTLASEETRTLRIPLPAGAAIVPVEVEAGSSFRPADVDRSSTDTRQLGCQVRLVLE